MGHLQLDLLFLLVSWLLGFSDLAFQNLDSGLVGLSKLSGLEGFSKLLSIQKLLLDIFFGQLRLWLNKVKSEILIWKLG